MRAYADETRPLATVSANFASLEEEVDTAIGPIAKATEPRKRSCSAKTLLESVE
jgi:hypothetical protein